MAFSPINSWLIDEGKIETVETKKRKIKNFLFLDSKITADSDCSLEVKRCLLLGRKAMTILGSILKSRDITADTGVCSQSYGFSSNHV